MRLLFAFLLPLLLVLQAHADDISREALQGRWLITAIDDEPETIKNYWEFSGDNFRLIEDGKQKSEERFAVKPMAIDLGYMNVRVTAFDGKLMKARFAGFTYTLKKE